MKHNISKEISDMFDGLVVGSQIMTSYDAATLLGRVYDPRRRGRKWGTDGRVFRFEGGVLVMTGERNGSVLSKQGNLEATIALLKTGTYSAWQVAEIVGCSRNTVLKILGKIEATCACGRRMQGHRMWCKARFQRWSERTGRKETNPPPKRKKRA